MLERGHEGPCDFRVPEPEPEPTPELEDNYGHRQSGFVRQYVRPTIQKRQSLLTFPQLQPGPKLRRIQIFTQSQMVFRPFGLMLWGCAPDWVVKSEVGQDDQLRIAHHWIPTRWFSSWQSYEQVAKAHAEGKQPPSWGTWSSLEVGMHFMLHLKGETPIDPQYVQALVWGISLVHSEERHD